MTVISSSRPFRLCKKSIFISSSSLTRAMSQTPRPPKRFAPLDPHGSGVAGAPVLKGVVFDVDGTLWYVRLSLVLSLSGMSICMCEVANPKLPLHVCFCVRGFWVSNAASLSEYENTISCFREHRFCYLKEAPAICLCLTRALEPIFDQHPLGICPAVTAPVSVLSNKTCPDLSNTFSKPQSYMFKQMR